MIDYYALPPSGEGRAWPSRAAASMAPLSERALMVEQGMAASILEEMGTSWDSRLFMPFVVMHEFEALLFSDCEAFARAINQEKLAPKLREIRKQFNNPEEIDDSPATHPSRRVTELMRSYKKPVFGVRAAQAIGLDRMRAECPHFAEWLGRLEALPHR